MKPVVVIFDSGNPKTDNNQLFDKDFVYPISHTYLPICFLHDKALEKNITFITPDVFLKNPKQFENNKVFLISLLVNERTEEIIAAGAIPLILICLESPFIATRFYLQLNKISSKFKHSFVFSGMKDKLSKQTQYHQTFFPESDCKIIEDQPGFSEKRFLTMISSAKSIGSWKKDLLLKLSYGFDVKEIYTERLKAIEYFSQESKMNGFDLFGYQWDKIKTKNNTRLAIDQTYRGAVDDKKATLKRYKFALCFENSIFEGYITEKIFDCFFAGVIPIYYGAPDIEKYIPENTFIDFRKFKNYDELYFYIKNMDESEYSQYINNIENFLESDQFYLFTQENFANAIINILNKE